MSMYETDGKSNRPGPAWRIVNRPSKSLFEPVVGVQIDVY
jgi:hypothetical protein